MNSCSACTTAVLVLRSPRPSGGASIQQHYIGSQWELSFSVTARPSIFFAVTWRSVYILLLRSALFCRFYVQYLRVIWKKNSLCGVITCKWSYRTSDVSKSRIHDRLDYCDFRIVPWFSAIAVILCHGRDYHRNMQNFNFQMVNLSKYLYRISFLCTYSLIINLTSWPRVCAHRTMASCKAAQLFLRSDRLRVSDTASDTGACDHKHAVGQPHIRSE